MKVKVLGMILAIFSSVVVIADELDRGPQGSVPNALIVVETSAGVKEVYKAQANEAINAEDLASKAIADFVKPENKIQTLKSTGELDRVSSTNEAWYYWGVPYNYYNNGYGYNPYSGSYYYYGYNPYAYNYNVYGYNPYNYGYAWNGSYYNYYPTYGWGYNPSYGWSGYNPGYGWSGYPRYYYYWRY